MHAHRFAIAALALFALGQPSSSSTHPTPSARPCHSGAAAGAWKLPILGQNGSVDGFLFSPTSASPTYHFTAALLAGPTPCTTCLHGQIAGYLDDGVGPAPDFVVQGTYSGQWPSGAGTFSASLFRPTAAGPTGFVSGTFQHSPTSSAGGHFSGNWTICE